MQKIRYCRRTAWTEACKIQVFFFVKNANSISIRNPLYYQ